MQNLENPPVIQITQLPLNRFEKLESVIEGLQEHFKPKPKEEYLTRHEAADYLKINLATLWAWTKKGKVKSFGIGSRVYYKLSDIEAAMIPLNH